jgi:type IV secretion system protein TrbF
MLKLKFRERRSPSALHAPDPLDLRAPWWGVHEELLRQRREAFILAGLSLIAVAVLLVGYVRLAEGVRNVPFLYVVDRAGEVLPVGTADAVLADDARVISASLRDFLIGFRSLSPDTGVQEEYLKKVALYLPQNLGSAGSARDFVTGYLTRNNPRELGPGRSTTRTVEILSILKVPPDTAEPSDPSRSRWRIRWREWEQPIGGPATRSEWEAYAVLLQRPKRDIVAYDANPFGVYLTEFTFSRFSEDS